MVFVGAHDRDHGQWKNPLRGLGRSGAISIGFPRRNYSGTLPELPVSPEKCALRGQALSAFRLLCPKWNFAASFTIGHGGSGDGGGHAGEGSGVGGITGITATGAGGEQQGHGPIHDPGEVMPNPDDNGTGGPNSNIAFGAQTNATVALSGAQDRGGTHGIIIVGGHDTVTAATGSFWDQAAGAAKGLNAAVSTSAVATAEIAGLNHSETSASGATSAHEVSGVLDIGAPMAALANAGAHGAGFTSASVDHVDLGTAALHDSLSLHSGAFANQMHL